MKYILVHSYNGVPILNNKVYKFHNIIESNSYITVCLLCDLKLPTWIKGETANFERKYWKDVTSVYDKINQLCVDLSADKSWAKIDDIRKKFKNGIYPTKSEFHYMNKQWNKLK